jgi:hypothetical protein
MKRQPLRTIGFLVVMGSSACRFVIPGLALSDVDGGTPPPVMPGPDLAPTVDLSDLSNGPSSDGPAAPMDGSLPQYGAPCSSQMPCAGGLACIASTSHGDQKRAWPDGYCASDCGSGCPAGTLCLDIGAMLCLAACDSGCRSGYECCTGVCAPSGSCD